MAFQLIERNRVAVQVKGQLPDEAGKPQPFSFTLHCKRLGAQELREVLKDDAKTTVDFMADVVQGWSGVTGDEGAMLPFTEAALNALLDVPGVAGLAFAAYMEQQAARAKN